MGKADLHVHSLRSDGMASPSQIMHYAETQTDLDLVAIADHDQVAGALEAVEWCAGRPQVRMQTIVATEISAAWGRHVLALFFAAPFPTRPFPRHRSLAYTVAMVEAAGGIVAVPHPLSSLVPSIGARTLDRLLERRSGGLEGRNADEGRRTIDESGSVDRPPSFVRRGPQALEVCSGVIGGRRAEPRLRRLNARRWGLAHLGSSDAHHLAQLGSAYTSFPGTTPADLRRAILDRTTDGHWGNVPSVALVEHVRQNWLSLFVKPARELRALATLATSRR
jgi:hypothetical protein